MKNILVLGDCASAGTNVLTHEITGEKGALIEYSLSWNGTYWKDINRWYLKKTKNNRKKKTDFSLIPFYAIEYLVEQELINSYWKYISQPIHNMSKIGATAYGYYKRLKKYEKKFNRKPDVIFVSDYSIRHDWQRVNHKGHKYFFEKGYDVRKPEFSVNPRLTAPVEVQRIAHDKAKLDYNKGIVEKRATRIMSWFINYLTKNNYRFYKIRFYQGFKEFDNNADVLDCLDLQRKYKSGAGERVDLKVEVAPLIAQRIAEKFSWLTLKRFN
jgi:hypothetical protein|tara:strand:+ start:78 stop:887 length:810 start_codon:yes stop_codon:yes gene_type:complete